MILQNWWFTTLLGIDYPITKPLTKNTTADVLIIGGGMSGVSAANAFIGSGLKVILLEKNILGGSSTGKSAGFLTPDSELELSQLIRRFGVDGAKEIWEVPCRGIDKIVENVNKYTIECDLIKQDSLFVGIGKSGWQDVQDEVESRTQADLKSIIYNQADLKNVFGGNGYNGAVRYSDTYGIDALQYVQGMKKVLLDNGIEVYESTAVTSIEGHTANTHLGSVTANKIIIAIDKMENDFSHFAKEVFHAQTFLSISEPLSDAEITQLFPTGEHFQCWDSTLVYSYYRLTGDNRLLLGGGSVPTSFLPNAYNKPGVINGVIKDFKKHFPFLNNLQFIQYWPGLIDTTRDLLPVIVKDNVAPHLHFIFGVVGLPWASFCGDFIGRDILGKARADEKRYYEYFSDRRNFFLPSNLGKLIGKPLLFSINNGWAKYYQVDKNRLPKFEKGEF